MSGHMYSGFVYRSNCSTYIQTPEIRKIRGFLFYNSVWCNDNIRGLGPCVEGLIPSIETSLNCCEKIPLDKTIKCMYNRVSVVDDLLKIK